MKRRVVRQARQVRHIIDRLLIFARGEPGAGTLSRVELESCIEQARELVAPKLVQDGIEVRVRADPQGLRVFASPLELEHVFLNLLLNAIHAIAGKTGEGARLIEVRISARGEEALVEIEDTGGGIAEEVMEAAFDPFVTTKPAGSGTGLGLVFVMSAMKSFGGTARIMNGQRGAIVQLTFQAAGEA